MKTIKTTIRNRRIEVPAPHDIPDGTEVTLTIGESKHAEDEAASPEEIARVVAAMRLLEPLEIPSEVASDLDDWEHKVNQHGIVNQEVGLEDVFP